MKISRRGALSLLAAATQASLANRLLGAVPGLPANPAGRVASSAERNLAEGPFEPSWHSLKTQYKTPDWFRDAKFGI